MMKSSCSSDEGVSSMKDSQCRDLSPSACDWGNTSGSSVSGEREKLKLDFSSCSSSPSLLSPFTPPLSPLKKKVDISSPLSPVENPSKSKVKMSTSSLKRVRSMNQRGGGFRRSKSIPKFGSEVDTTDSKTSSNKILGDEVTFRVRRSLFGRHGWIVMSTDDSHDLKQLNDVIISKLSDKIRDLEFSGKDVPNEITIKIKE